MYKVGRTSFLSEHSVEFCLVSQFCRILEASWEVTPLYFWKTREGSRLALAHDDSEQVKIIAMFARRPKLSHVGDSQISIKINASLKEKAFQLSKLGIPVICGVPLVTSILDFQLTSPCVWFKINSNGEDYNDTFVVIGKGGREFTYPHGYDNVLAIIDDDISSLAEKAKSVSLVKAIEGLRSSPQPSGFGLPSGYLWFMSTYKPVYFLLRKGSQAHDD